MSRGETFFAYIKDGKCERRFEAHSDGFYEPFVVSQMLPWSLFRIFQVHLASDLMFVLLLLDPQEQFLINEFNQ